jgi:putative spermidine/putrescine transport system permease protein
VALMVLPVLLVVAGLFGLGFATVFAQSLGIGIPGQPGPSGPTVQHYRDLAQNREFYLSLGFTLWVATCATAVSVTGGVALALLLDSVARGRRIVYALLQVPLAVPHLAMAVVAVTLLAQSGLVARLAYAVGLIAGPAGFPALVYDRWGIGTLLAYAAKEIPFIAVVGTALLARIGPEYDAVAQTLGASRWQRIRHVTLPLLAPGVGGAALMVFAYVFAAFETPFVLGRPYPAMLSVVAQREFMSLDLADRPGAMALAFVMTLLSALVVRAYLALSRAALGPNRPALF